MKKGIFLFIFALVFGSSFAQTRWYFGSQAGIEFDLHGDSLRLLSDSKMKTIEGSAVQCDEEGAVLFYSNGVSVWNAENEIMLNGANLMGGTSASQSVAISPLPHHPQKYVLITTNDLTHARTKKETGLRYSLIDMSLDEGRGGILTDKKNVLIDENSGEKLAVTPHGDGINYWLIYTSAQGVRAIEIDSSGLDARATRFSKSQGNPIDFTLGESYMNYDLGQLKVSPSGRLIANAYNDFRKELSEIELFTFDPCTGEIHREVSFRGNEVKQFNLSVYGIEFSPNEQFLYSSQLKNSYGSSISQFDIGKLKKEDIEGSEYILEKASFGIFCSSIRT